MHTRRQWLIPVAALLFLPLSESCASAAEKWNFAFAIAPTNFQVQNARNFAKEVKDATGGEVDIVVHAGGALGFKGPDHLAAVRDGLVQMASIQMNQQVGEDVFFGIESLPFLATSYDELKLLQKFTRPVFDEITTKFNQKILYLTPWPPQNFFSKTPVSQSPGQFNGLKVRTIDKNATDFFGKLGATTIQLPWGEVVPSLASGAINAVATSSVGGVDGLFWEFIKHYTVLGWQMNTEMVTVNLDAWKRLKPDAQAKIEAIAKRSEPEFWKISVAQDASNVVEMRKNGMQIDEISPEMKANLRQIGESLWTDYLTKAGPRAQKAIESYKAALK